MVGDSDPTVKGTVAAYIGVATDLPFEGNYRAIREAIADAVAKDAALQDVSLDDFPLEHHTSLGLALLRVMEDFPLTQRAARAAALLQQLEKKKKLLADRRYGKTYREKVRLSLIAPHVFACTACVLSRSTAAVVVCVVCCAAPAPTVHLVYKHYRSIAVVVCAVHHLSSPKHIRDGAARCLQRERCMYSSHGVC